MREGDELTAVVLGVHAPQRRVALSLRPSDCAEPRAQPLLGSRPPTTTPAAPRKPSGSGEGREAGEAGEAGAAGASASGDEAARLLPDGAMELWPTLNERLLRAPLLWQPRAERQMRELLGVGEHASCRAGRAGLHGPTALQRLCRHTSEGGGGGGGEGGGEDDSEEPSLEEVRRQQNRAWAAETVARGVAYAKAGREAEALAAYRQALDLDPRHCDALVARGAAHANAGRLPEAVSDFERALSLQPDERNARRYLHATVARMTPAQRRLLAPQVRQLLQPLSAAAPQPVASPAAAAAAAASAAAPAPAGGGSGLVAAVVVARGGAAAAASAEVRSANGGTSGAGSGGGSAAGGASAAAVCERTRALGEMVEALRRKDKRERRSKRKKKRDRKQGKRKGGKKKRARDGAEEPPRKRKRSPKESTKESGSSRKRRHRSPSEVSSSSSSSTGNASPARDEVAAQMPSQGSAMVDSAVAAPAVGLTPGLTPARVVRLGGSSDANPEEDRDMGKTALEKRAARFGGGVKATPMLTSELKGGAG